MREFYTRMSLNTKISQITLLGTCPNMLHLKASNDDILIHQRHIQMYTFMYEQVRMRNEKWPFRRNNKSKIESKAGCLLHFLL